MAVQPYTVVRIMGENDVYGFSFTWTLNGGDTGNPVSGFPFLGYRDRSIQMIGNTTLNWEGSHDGNTFVTLNDPGLQALSLTTGGAHEVLEAMLYMRPNNTGGNTVTVILVAARTLR